MVGLLILGWYTDYENTLTIIQRSTEPFFFLQTVSAHCLLGKTLSFPNHVSNLGTPRSARHTRRFLRASEFCFSLAWRNERLLVQFHFSFSFYTKFNPLGPKSDEN